MNVQASSNQPPPAHHAVSQLLWYVQAQLENAEVATGMRQLMARLHAARLGMGPAQWRVVCRELVAPHPLRALVHESPLTRQAHDKPRGYAGDPELLDFIYELAALPAHTSGLGRAIYAWEVLSDSSMSVRWRKGMLAATIDEVARQRPGAQVLSVACGHLREAACSEAARTGALGRYVAMDHDAQSLALVRQEHGGLGVSTLHAPVRSLLTGHDALTGFDLVYAAGLYDHLRGDSAMQLTASLFRRLRPRGRLVLASSAPDSPQIAYVEAFMDWWLSYRAEDAMRRLAAAVPKQELAGLRVSREPLENLVFLELSRG